MTKKIFKRGKNGNGNGVTAKVKKQRVLFVEHYLKDFNAKYAYLQLHPDVTEGTATVEGCKYLRNPKTMRLVDQRISEMFSKLEVRNELLIAELLKIALVDIRGFFNEDGTFKELSELNIAQQSAIQSIEVEELFSGRGEDREWIGRTKKYKFYSRKEAVDTLMKYRGLIKDASVFNIQLNDNRKIEFSMGVKELKEKLGADRIIELNNLLEAKES